VVLSAVVQLVGAGAILRGGPPHPIHVVTFALALAGPLVLIGARRFPGPVAVSTGVLAVVSMLFAAGGGPLPLAFAFGLAGAVVRGAGVWAWASLAGAWAAVFAVSVVGGAVPWPPPRLIGTALGLVLAVGLGELVASRRARVAAFRAAASRRRQSAAEEERMRIARELHDVLAHSLSQINVQAGVGLHLADTQPDKAIEALATIKAASKTALDDVRSVLGVLRAEGDAPLAPQAGVGSVAELVASTDVPGARVVLDDALASLEVPAPVGAAAYRIVQESLTNVVRHGSGVTRVEVRLAREGGDGIRVEVRDDGREADFEPGRGLTGMRERVEQLGGSFDAGYDADPGCGFVVRAVLPVRGGRS
jgi:signal transduction histidine kinase